MDNRTRSLRRWTLTLALSKSSLKAGILASCWHNTSSFEYMRADRVMKLSTNMFLRGPQTKLYNHLTGTLHSKTKHPRTKHQGLTNQNTSPQDKSSNNLTRGWADKRRRRWLTDWTNVLPGHFGKWGRLECNKSKKPQPWITTGSLTLRTPHPRRCSACSADGAPPAASP